MQLWLKSKKKILSSETIRSHTRDLKAFRRYLVDQKLKRDLDELSIPDTPPVGRKNWLAQIQVDKIIEAATDNDLKFILHAGFNAGLRRNEISEARCDWFDLGNGLLHVFSNDSFTTKDREGRSIPIKKTFLEFLKTYLAGKSGYVLAPTKFRGKGVYRFDANRRVRTHFRKCKVKCSWHDMRRSFASNLVTKGESIFIVSSWLGDGIEVVQKSYAHLSPAAGDINR
jgi:integrase